MNLMCDQEWKVVPENKLVIDDAIDDTEVEEAKKYRRKSLSQNQWITLRGLYPMKNWVANHLNYLN